MKGVDGPRRVAADQRDPVSFTVPSPWLRAVVMIRVCGHFASCQNVKGPQDVIIQGSGRTSGVRADLNGHA